KISPWQERPGLGVSLVSHGGTFIATVAEVQVHRATGILTVPRVWVAVNVGLAVQPANVRRLIRGGVVMGLSHALIEQVTIRDGGVEQSNFHDYPIAILEHVPDITVEVLETSGVPSAVGELGGLGVAGAVANGFADLTNRNIRHMPFLPERVLDALK
ncbi:MAG: molybdopterin cofactor-binding domain-containing protein, partial [Pseudomonadota bacterium]